SEQSRSGQFGAKGFLKASFVSDDAFCNVVTGALFLGHFGVRESYKESQTPLPSRVKAVVDPATRQQCQIDEILRDTQHLLAESPYVRQKCLKKLTDCKTVEEYEKVAEEYREFFATEVI